MPLLAGHIGGSVIVFPGAAYVRGSSRGLETNVGLREGVFDSQVGGEKHEVGVGGVGPKRKVFERNVLKWIRSI